MRLFIRPIIAAIALLALHGAQGALAQAWWTDTKDGIPVPSIATSLPRNGDPAGIRKRLADRGIVYGLEYTSDTLANVHGGSRVGTIYQGKLQGILTVDLAKLAGWQGLTLFANAYQIHNTGRIRKFSPCLLRSYPLSTPGVRLRVDPNEQMALLLAVFNGDPAGPGEGDEQERNKHGLNFRMRDPAFVIGEAQFRRNHGPKDTALATTFKLGGWYHFGRFDDQLVATGGTLLADPAGTGVPITHRGNYGLYAVIDQQIYRPKVGDDQTGIFVFGRASVSPSDQNVASLFADGGVLFAGMVPGRPDDKFGASVMYTRFSDSIREFDRQTIFFTGVPGPVRDYEANLELTYMAQIVPGWTVQPVLTRVWHPSGDRSRNAVVTGVRSLWRF